jgi:hypothetical protein
MLTFAEYNFIRAEQLWFTRKCTNVFQEGKASMESAGVVAADIAAYLATNGTLTGTDAKN